MAGHDQPRAMDTGDRPGERGVAAASPSEVAARALRRGEPDAVAEVERRVGRILAFKSYGLGAEQRRELVQDVMSEIWQVTQRPGFDPTAGFWGLVELVTSRRAIDALRRRRPHAELSEELPDRGAGPAERAIERERVRLAGRALARLEPACRELIRLFVGEGRSYREISLLLGRSEGALRVQMYRCVRGARRRIQELAPGAGSREAT